MQVKILALPETMALLPLFSEAAQEKRWKNFISALCRKTAVELCCLSLYLSVCFLFTGCKQRKRLRNWTGWEPVGVPSPSILSTLPSIQTAGWIPAHFQEKMGIQPAESFVHIFVLSRQTGAGRDVFFSLIHGNRKIKVSKTPLKAASPSYNHKLGHSDLL